MTHTLHPAHRSLFAEARLAYENAAPNLGELENLHMREEVAGDAVAKNKYAYDKVKDRIDQYLEQVKKLKPNIQENDTDIRTIRAPLEGEKRETLPQLIDRLRHVRKEQSLLFKDPQNPNYVFGREANGIYWWNGKGWVLHKESPEAFYKRAFVTKNLEGAVTPPEPYLQYSKDYKEWAESDFKQNYDTYKYTGIDKYSQNKEYHKALVNRIYWSVQNLERHYLKCREIILGLEITAGIRDKQGNPIKDKETLDSLMLKQRTDALGTQMAATEDKNKLQTISLDAYNKPFTQIDKRAYHLLRLPADVTAVFSSDGDEISGLDIQTVELSGGAKYLKFTPEALKRIITSNLKLELKRGGDTFTETVEGAGYRSIATIARTADEQNLIFTFEKNQVKEKEEERAPDVIEVPQPKDIFTGFEREVVVKPDLTPERRRALVVKHGDKEISPGSVFDTKKGYTIRRNANGNIFVESTDASGGEVDLTITGGEGTTKKTEKASFLVRQITVEQEQRKLPDEPGNNNETFELSSQPSSIEKDQGYETFVTVKKPEGPGPFKQAPEGSIIANADPSKASGYLLSFKHGTLTATRKKREQQSITLYFCNGYQVIERRVTPEDPKADNILKKLSEKPMKKFQLDKP